MKNLGMSMSVARVGLSESDFKIVVFLPKAADELDNWMRINAPEDWRISKIKECIFQEKGIPENVQRLFWEGHALPDAEPVSRCLIKDCEIDLEIVPPGRFEYNQFYPNADSVKHIPLSPRHRAYATALPITPPNTPREPSTSNRNKYVASAIALLAVYCFWRRYIKWHNAQPNPNPLLSVKNPD